MNSTRHFFRRQEVWKTTWRFRLAAVGLLALIVFSTRTFWLECIGRSLVHDDAAAASDVVVIENYDQDYLVFEGAARLVRNGYADHLLIPLPASKEPDMPNAVYAGFVDVMIRVARIEGAQILPVVQEEPITLTVARQVAEALNERGVRSAIVVSPRFRSRRTYEVYRNVLSPSGIELRVVAAGGSRTSDNWWATTHGVQQVFLEFVKLQYYRLFVL